MSRSRNDAVVKVNQLQSLKAISKGMSKENESIKDPRDE